ncbi:MAG: AMP-binding protein [Cyclobacteriaceae bacterium]
MKKFDSPLEAFLYWETNTPNNEHLIQLLPGETKKYTYKESGQEIRRIAAALKSYNLPDDSKIALISKNCAHWMMADLAIMMAGYISVPIYPTLGADTINHILVHSESQVVILGKLDDYESQRSGIPENIKKIGVGMYDMNDGDQWEDLLENHEPIDQMAEQDPESLITIIYTSGTTGLPKGVMHTISSFNFMGNLCLDIFTMPEQANMFSYLPLSHIAERIGIEMQGTYRGASFTFPESIDTFAADLASTQPHLFFAVPRIWSKFQEKILEKMPQKKLDTLLKIPILKGIVKKKLKTALGLSRAKYIFSGAAPIAVSMLEWYEKIGIEILQGYGMTEDTIHSHFNLPGANRKGTVGKPLPECVGKLSAEGEICLKGQGLMKGYYKMEDKTAESFDSEGYLKTGDIGEYDHDGYLLITGRVKDQFKTDKGKYISPAPIELELMKNPDIEQVCVVGTGIPQPIALIVTSLEAKSKSNEELIQSLEASIKEINPSLEKHERLEKAVVMKEDWAVENGLLTPTMKVKRNQIEKIHSDFYREWFNTDLKVIFE